MVRLKDCTTAKGRLRTIGAVVAAVASVAGMLFAAAPAAAAYPISTFAIPYGASYYNGTATWYNRSVGVTGTFRAVGCRRVYGRAWAGTTMLDFKSSSTWCDTIGPATLPLDADVVGGANKVWIYMTDGAGTYLNGETCYRGVSDCVDGLW